MKENFKSEKGVITALVLISMLFIISFLITTYILVSNKVKGQVAVTKEIEKTYNNIDEINAIYNNFFAGDVAEIATVEDLRQIGYGNPIVIKGKIYKENTVFVLTTDLNFIASEYGDEDWNPVGNKAGNPNDNTNYTFEGNGHTITVTKIDNTVKEYNEGNGYGINND